MSKFFENLGLRGICLETSVLVHFPNVTISLSVENLRKSRTAGYFVLKHLYPAARYLDTAKIQMSFTVSDKSQASEASGFPSVMAKFSVHAKKITHPH